MMNATIQLPSGVRRGLPKRRILLTIALIVGLAFVAIHAAAAATRTDGSTPDPGITATIYRIDAIGVATRLTPVTITIPAGHLPILYAINAMAGLSGSPLPSGTQARSVVVDSDGIVTIDFNRAFLLNFHGGDEAESYAVNSLLLVVGQFPQTNQIKVTVMGSTVDSLGGHFDLSVPVDVIRQPAPMYRHRKPSFQYHPGRVMPSTPKHA
jgi:hypothetical protein